MAARLVSSQRLDISAYRKFPPMITSRYVPTICFGLIALSVCVSCGHTPSRAGTAASTPPTIGITPSVEGHEIFQVSVHGRQIGFYRVDFNAKDCAASSLAMKLYSASKGESHELANLNAKLQHPVVRGSLYLAFPKEAVREPKEENGWGLCAIACDETRQQAEYAVQDIDSYSLVSFATTKPTTVNAGEHVLWAILLRRKEGAPGKRTLNEILKEKTAYDAWNVESIIVATQTMENTVVVFATIECK